MLPHIILHSMVSVDGRMALPAPDLGLYYEVASRWEVDAILSGSETILTGFGDPEADVQDVASNSAQKGPGILSDGPLMVIPDSRERVRKWALIRRQQPYWRDAIALVSATTPEEYLASLEG